LYSFSGRRCYFIAARRHQPNGTLTWVDGSVYDTSTEVFPWFNNSTNMRMWECACFRKINSLQMALMDVSCQTSNFFICQQTGVLLRFIYSVYFLTSIRFVIRRILL